MPGSSWWGRLCRTVWLTLLLVGVFPGFPQATTADEPEEQTRLIEEEAKGFVDWLLETPRAELTRDLMCARADGAHERAIGDGNIEGQRFVRRLTLPASGNQPDGTQIRAITDYFVLHAIDYACQTEHFLLYDPLIRQAETEEEFAVVREENFDFPVCDRGPSLGVERRQQSAILTAIREFGEAGQLKRLLLNCMGLPETPLFSPFYLFIASELRVADFVVVNSHLGTLSLRNVQIDRLRLDGTQINDAALASNAPQETQPQTSGTSSRRTGLQIAELEVADSRIAEVLIRGASLGYLRFDALASSRKMIFSRTDVSALTITRSSFKDIALFQVEVAPRPEGHSLRLTVPTAVTITSNRIEGDMSLGSLPRDHFGADMISRILASRTRSDTDPMAAAALGPPLTGTSAEQAHEALFKVRGPISLARNRIEGALQLHRLDVDVSESAEEARPLPNSVTLDGTRARSIEMVGSIFRFARRAGFVAADLIVAEDIRIRNSLFLRHWAEDLRERTTNNYAQRFSPPSDASLDDGLSIWLTDLTARDLRLEQNLVVGPIHIEHPKLRNLAILTHRDGNEVERDGRPGGFCAAYPRGQSNVNLARMEGGLLHQRSRAPPWWHNRFPPCYGSTWMVGGQMEMIFANAMLSDLMVVGTRIAGSVSILGRVGGVINLADLRLESGTLRLGTPGEALTWCGDASLILDGARIATLQADLGSFVGRRDCRADLRLDEVPPIRGPLRIGLRGAHIGQFSGLAGLLPQEDPDPGFLGLRAERIIASVLPDWPEMPSLGTRLAALFRADASDGTGGAAVVDPQALALLARALKEDGHAAKAVDLTLERISRQKWLSGDVMDRTKWLLGWPIGWGQQIEWAFLYTFVFILMGAWVAAYYRRYPARSPPSAGWPQRNSAERQHAVLRAATHRLLLIALLVVAVCAPVFLSVAIPLTRGETLALAGVIILGLAVYNTLKVFRFFDAKGRRLALRFALSARDLGYHSFFFSLDRFLPSPGFHSYWGNYPKIGQIGRSYFYFHRFVGLVLVSVVAAGFIGIFD